jgi:hypothetical protein
MSTNITINDDQTLTVTWTGKKGRGSLFQLAAKGNAEAANKLSIEELLAVVVSVQSCPFPLGDERKVYERCLEIVRTDPTQFWNDGLPKIALGDLRYYIVQKAGGGFNAPHDSYLKLAADLADEAAPAPDPQPVQADFEITYRGGRKSRFAVVEGSGRTRTVVSWHRKRNAAEKAHAKWKAPAKVICLDRQTGEVWHPAP